MSQAKTIRVRIAVCVSEDGDYSANGWRTKGKDAGRKAANMAHECMEGNDGDKQIWWVEATFLPVRSMSRLLKARQLASMSENARSTAANKEGGTHERDK